MLAAIAATAFAVASVRGAPGTNPRPCAATTVRYGSAKQPTLGELPWVLARPERADIAAFLASYQRTLRDGRVNASDGLVLWDRGEKIVWAVAGTMAAPSIVARRLDGRGSFRIPVSPAEGGFASTPRFPATGCWRLTVRSAGNEATLVARVVARPTALGCEATQVSLQELAVARPHSAGLAGGFSWRTSDDRLLLYTHGVGPGDLNAKVPWWSRRGGGSLALTGTRLDGAGLFRQEFQEAGGGSSQPPGYRTVFPSIVDVPAPGCWLLRLRTGTQAGVLVVRARDR